MNALGLGPVIKAFRWLVTAPFCPACGAEERYFDRLCASCVAGLRRPGDRTCLTCALPLVAGHWCGECLKTPPTVERVRAAWQYGEPIAKAVHAAKFGRQPCGIEYLAKHSIEVFQESMREFQPDFVLPMPLSTLRRFRRGYNQSEVLARAWLRNSGCQVPVLSGLRRAARAPQAMQDRAARLRSLRGSMRYQGKTPLQGKRVLLVDDVMTTGATIETAARELRRAGAQIAAVALAKVLKQPSLGGPS